MLAEPTVFHLVRHAAHGLLPHTLAGRIAGVGLSAEGRAQAAGLAGRLGASDVVVSSPVQRARETAAAIAGGRGVVVDAGFEEIDFGGWTGMRFDALAGDVAWQAWNTLRSVARCPGGETMVEAQARAMGAVGRWCETSPGRCVVVVSHADVIKSVLAAALGLSLDQLQRIAIGPASLSTLVVGGGEMRVERVNA